MPSRTYTIVDAGSSSELRRTFGTIEAAASNMMLAGALHHMVHDVVGITREIQVTEKRLKKSSTYSHPVYRVWRQNEELITTKWLQWINENMVTQAILPLVLLAHTIVQPGWTNLGDVLYYAHCCRYPVRLYDIYQGYEKTAKRMKTYALDAKYPRVPAAPQPRQEIENIIDLSQEDIVDLSDE
jgi:hypothetical protein